MTQAGKERTLDTTFLRAGGEAASSESGAGAAQEAGLSSRSVLRVTLLALAGFLVGLVLFLPSDILWTRALKAVESEDLRIRWKTVLPMGLLGAKLEDAALDMGGVSLHFSSVEIDPGLLSPLALRLRTADRTINAGLSWTGRLRASGQADTAVLTAAPEASGVMDLRADLRFSWSEAIPESGSLEVAGLDLPLPGNLLVHDARLALIKQDRDLSLESFSLEKPFPIEGRGSAELDPGKLEASTFELSGKIVMGGKARDFNLSGKLPELIRMASGRGAG
jgi:hypothetical protein